jgi:23S rRNA (uridine2552-2'-O)-methyltransferase
MQRVQDHYFRQAKREGYAARSAYKLEEIDRRRGLLRPGMRVLDLGCAPGSWLQYAAARVGERGEVIGIDLRLVTVILPPWVRAIQGDVFETRPEAWAQTLSGQGQCFDLILSDMAPKTTGVPSGDAARSAALALRALELAGMTLARGGTLLRQGGALLVKVFQGARFPDLRQGFRERFDRVTVEKPKASRAESVELYLLGLGFRPDGLRS